MNATRISINDLHKIFALKAASDTIIEKDKTIMTPVATEYSPDANGRYGLLTCNATFSKDLQLDNLLMLQAKSLIITVSS